jgi:CBS domain-containing protein
MTDEERNEGNEEGTEEREEESGEESEEREEESSSSSSSSDDDGDDGEGGGGGSGKTTVADVMSKDPASVEPGASIEDAAKAMKEKDTGALLVVDGDELKGIVTDRDIVVNAIAEGNSDAKVEDVASTDTTTIKPDAALTDAITKMRESDVRRLPVVEDDGGKPVGIVSLGDLAIAADDDSALKDISQASPNN